MCVTANDHCCCCHVKVGVEVLGWVGAVLNGLSLIGGLINRSITSIIGGILGVLIYVGLIIAKRKGSHRWYLPFLVLNALCLALEVILLVLTMILLATSNYDGWQQFRTSWGGISVQVRGTGASTAILVVIYTLPIVWTSYTHHVVSRAYKCVKRESTVTRTTAA